MWRAPALDFIVSAGATFEARSGLRVDRRASVRAAGEIAHLSYDATVTSGQLGALGAVRVKAFRSDPDGGLLGPLDATHFALGDVPGPTSRLIAGGAGRGAEITNRPLFNAAAFDRTRFEGDLAPGWDAELYRNGQLLAFAKGDGVGRYLFDEVQLDYGENRFEIISYGPRRDSSARASKRSISARVTCPRATPGIGPGPTSRAATCSASSARIGGSIAIRRSIGPALVEVAAAKQSGGGIALRGSALARIGGVNLAAEAVSLENFFYQGRFEERLRNGRLSVSAPLATGKVPILLQGDVR